MEFEPLTEDEVVRLWPTTVMKQALPGAEAANPLLETLAEEAADGAPVDEASEAGAWLLGHIGHGARRYLAREGRDGAGLRVAARLEVHGFGAYRGLKPEPDSLLCGRYGVTLPADVAPGPKRDDLHPGFLSFYDPRSAMNMNAIRRDPYLHYHRSIPLKPGLLLMWPGYLGFFIHPNLSETPRVSVAFHIYKEAGAA